MFVTYSEGAYSNTVDLAQAKIQCTTLYVYRLRGKDDLQVKRSFKNVIRYLQLKKYGDLL